MRPVSPTRPFPLPAGLQGQRHPLRAPGERAGPVERRGLQPVADGGDGPRDRLRRRRLGGVGREGGCVAAAGLGWTQLSGIFDGTGILERMGHRREDGWAAAFGAYAVVNCNGTSDGSFLTPTTPGATGSRITVPVLVETTSGFLSELVLSNRSGSEATLKLDYVESLSPAPGAGGEVSLKVGPGEQLIVPDALEYLRGKGLGIGTKGAANYAGALRVSVEGAALSDVFAGARTAAALAVGGAVRALHAWCLRGAGGDDGGLALRAARRRDEPDERGGAERGGGRRRRGDPGAAGVRRRRGWHSARRPRPGDARAGGLDPEVELPREQGCARTAGCG